MYMSSYDTPAKCLLVALCLGGLYYLLISGRRSRREGLTSGSNKSGAASSSEYTTASQGLDKLSKEKCEGLKLGEGKNKDDVKAMLDNAGKNIDSFVFYETVATIEALGNGASAAGIKQTVDNIEALKKLKTLATDAEKALSADVCSGKTKKSMFH